MNGSEQAEIGNTSDDGFFLTCIQLYSGAVTAYFSTFNVYLTATTIMLATAGLLFNQPEFADSSSGSELAFVSWATLVAGLWICCCWHTSTWGRRRQYQRYLTQLWKYRRDNDCQNLPEIPNPDTPLKKPPADCPQPRKLLKWAWLIIRAPWFAKGASLPFVYGALFAVLFLREMRPCILTNSPEVTAIVFVVVVLGLSGLAGYHRAVNPPVNPPDNPSDREQQFPIGTVTGEPLSEQIIRERG